MATLLSALITDVRTRLVAPIATDLYWTDAEILIWLNQGIKDLWRAINDNYQNYFLTVDATNVYLAANGTTVTGTPADVSIVRKITPRSLSTYPYVRFEHRPFDHRDFVAAEAQGAVDTQTARLIYFDVTDAGGPVAAPTIRVAPSLSSQMLLTLGYVPVLATKTATDNNPIPGESDNALVSYAVAYARGREREDRGPDPEWIRMYATEKANILVSLTPRQTQDEVVAEALFQEFW